MDLTTLGERPTRVLPYEQPVFQKAKQVLWVRALQYCGQQPTSKMLKLTINQGDLDRLQGLTHAAFCELSTDLKNLHQRHTSTVQSQATGGAADLFFRVANHFYHNTSGHEFRTWLGYTVRRYDFHKRATPASCGPDSAYIPFQMHPKLQFADSMLRCFLIICKIESSCGGFPMYVTHSNVVECQKRMRNRTIELGKALCSEHHLQFCDLFHAGLLLLVLRGYIVGEVRRFTGGRDPKVLAGWHGKALQHIVALGFPLLLGGEELEANPHLGELHDFTTRLVYPLHELDMPGQAGPTSGPSAGPSAPSGPMLSLKCWAYLAHWSGYNANPSPSFAFETFVKQLPVFVENPTAFLECMWFVHPYNGLRHHVSYCQYGASW